MQPVTLDSILPHLWIAGRSSRAEWWRVHIVCAVVATIFDEMFIARLQRGFGGLDDAPVTILWLAITAVLGWVSFASVVRRLQDRSKSGWWALLYLLPGIGWLWLIIECGFLPSRQPAAATPAPAFAPPPTPRAAPHRPPREPRRPSRARLSAAPHVSTIQRLEHRPWTLERAAKLAGGAVGALLIGLVLYQWFVGPGFVSVKEIETNRDLPVFEQP